jgi:hypothetical protein
VRGEIESNVGIICVAEKAAGKGAKVAGYTYS